MHFTFVWLFISFGLHAASSAPESGLYRCVKGNDQSICDQFLKLLRTSSGSITGVKVFYEGYCNGQGPYHYGCHFDFCGDGIIRISFIDQAHYWWENRGSGRFCEMEKVGHTD